MTTQSLPFTAFVPAGGLGTRLRAVVNDRPKPMALVNGTPFLEILISSLAVKGIRQFVLLTGYRGDMIEQYFRERPIPYVSIAFSPEESPLGTGGSVKHAEAFATDPTLLVNGDTFFDADPAELFDFHRARGSEVTLSLVQVTDVSRYGSVLTDEQGMITAFVEKRPGDTQPGLVNGGLTLVSGDFVRSLPSGPFSMERDVFPSLVGSGKMFGLCQEGAFFDIGTPENYEEFKTFCKGSDLLKHERR